MSKHNVVELSGRGTSRDELTALIRDGARKLVSEALEVEVSELLASLSGRRDALGRAAVVRNGYQPERDIQTGVGPVTVKVPKVRSRDGQPVSFRSALVPPYVRKSASLEAALPWLYLKGISTGEMAPALEVLVGAEAKGLSASTVSRLKQHWREDYEGWRHRRLDNDRWAYIWADGIYSGLRAERQRLCALVIIGVNERGEKHFLAIEDGIRESTQSWREVLLGLESRGFEAPELAVGDGAMGFWAGSRKSSRRRVHNAAGCTKWAMCSTPCRRAFSPKQNRRCTTSGRHQPAKMPRGPSTSSSSPMKPSIQRRPPACSRIGNR
jgi:transposase-like protein